MTISVICDSCGKAGSAGAGEFSHLGDLLEFKPVPRQGNRVDAWSPELQRAFIAALATTGSTRRAAHALKKSPHGIIKLRKAKGADSFNVAFDRAMAIAARNGSLKVAQGVADAAVRGGHEPDDEESAMDEESKLALLENIHRKFLGKVRQEREARLEGKVVAADFYLRQITFLEVAFDMMAEGLGLDGWELLGEFRRGGHGVLEVAETPMSKALDTSRRELWRTMSESHPELGWGASEDGSGRPEHPPERYLAHDQDHSIEPLEYYCGGHEAAREAERARYAAQHAADAESQIEWERGAQTCRDRHAQPVRGTGEHADGEHSKGTNQ